MTQCDKFQPQAGFLCRFEDTEVHDLICVGFGPASLAVAIALQDTLQAGDPNIAPREFKARFLERQPTFKWHAGMLLPGAKMQISFLKDLATFRDPRSEFTFINYLHQKDRLVSFCNLGTFLPQRIEFEDYMRWCAGHFTDVVDYGQEVQKIEADNNFEHGVVQCFRITSFNHKTGLVTHLRARHVVIAAGGTPNIPKELQLAHPRVIHSCDYATKTTNMAFRDGQPWNVAVIGSGQSAAEVFNDIPRRFPNAKSTLFIRDTALRPSDDSPFVNEIFNPKQVDEFFNSDLPWRAQQILRNRATNYGVTRLELIEEIYSKLYSYSIQYKSEADWPHRIMTRRMITGLVERRESGESVIQLQVQDSAMGRCGFQTPPETMDVDMVVIACGYTRKSHEALMSSIRHLMPGGDTKDKLWTVGRNYRVNFEKNAVSDHAGIWLQGCNERTHGLSDSLLSVLAVRSKEIVEQILGS